MPKYNDTFPELLQAHLSQGFSFASFAGLIGVTYGTIKRWVEEYEVFRDAKEIGESRCRLFWEQVGIAATVGKVPNFNATAYKMQVQNRFPAEYGDKPVAETEVVSTGGALSGDMPANVVQFYLPDNGRRKTRPGDQVIDLQAN